MEEQLQLQYGDPKSPDRAVHTTRKAGSPGSTLELRWSHPIDDSNHSTKTIHVLEVVIAVCRIKTFVPPGSSQALAHGDAHEFLAPGRDRNSWLSTRRRKASYNYATRPLLRSFSDCPAASGPPVVAPLEESAVQSFRPSSWRLRSCLWLVLSVQGKNVYLMCRLVEEEHPHEISTLVPTTPSWPNYRKTPQSRWLHVWQLPLLLAL